MLKKEQIDKASELFLCISCNEPLDAETWSMTVINLKEDDRIFFCKKCFNGKEFEDINFSIGGVSNNCLVCEKNNNAVQYYLAYSNVGGAVENRWLSFHKECYECFVGADFIF